MHSCNSSKDKLHLKRSVVTHFGSFVEIVEQRHSTLFLWFTVNVSISMNQMAYRYVTLASSHG